MPDRKSLAATLWLMSSLALLASVLAAPIRPSGFVAASPRPDGLAAGFAPISGQPAARIGEAMFEDAILRVDALSSENEEPDRSDALAEAEEQDRADALDEPRISFLIPCSFRKIHDRQLIVPRSILSHYPLRC